MLADLWKRSAAWLPTSGGGGGGGGPATRRIVVDCVIGYIVSVYVQ